MRLRGEMHDGVDAHAVEQAADEIRVADVTAHEA